jgi:DNA helicase MCM8
MNGQLISTIGSVFSIEPIQAQVKIMCYQCTTCEGQLLIKQKNGADDELTEPTKCRKECSAKSGFLPLIQSPFTAISAKQKLVLKESSFKVTEIHRTAEAALIGEQVESLSIGQRVMVTGVVKFAERKHSFAKSNNSAANDFKSYIKVFNFEIINGPAVLYQEPNVDLVHELITTLKADPMIFKLLVQSLCPDVSGRDDAKAAIVLSLLSGSGLLKGRRSSCHTMLLGNPGTGKSALVMAAAALSPRGMFVCGPTSTQGGLIGTIRSDGTVEAGALVLSDNGVCCIDEIDKMGYAHFILLEAMEQQVVSICKYGSVSNAPARCSIIAAGNPRGSRYNYEKTVNQNMSILSSIISRFDLIVPMITDSKIPDFLVNRETDQSGDGEMEFFDTSNIARFNEKSHWYRLEHGKFMSKKSVTFFPFGRLTLISHFLDENIRPLPKHIMKHYIEYAREKCHPKLSPEAGEELRKFYVSFKEMVYSQNHKSYASLRTLVSLVRLTLAKVRAELRDVATLNDALQIIYLFKSCQIDFFTLDDQVAASNVVDYSKMFTYKTKEHKPQNVSSQSVPKQKKAFYEFLQEKTESEERNNFTLSELKEFASELGIKNPGDIIERIYMDGGLLKTVEGYRIL